MKAGAHLAAALHWSKASEAGAATALAAGLGMMVPALVGAALGHLPLGLAGALGAMTVADVAMEASAAAQLRGLAAAFVPAALAMLAAALVAGQGWQGEAAMILIAGAAAAIGGFNRRSAVAAARFVIYLIIGAHAVGASPKPAAFQEVILLAIAGGALWASALSLLLGTLVRLHLSARSERAANPPATRLRQNLRRWKSSLSALAGWNYVLRLTGCLAAAGMLQAVWPQHHFYWIALTVALLCQRQLEAFPVKTTQRALGTALGVLGASLVLAHAPPAWAVVASIGLLAGLRSLLRARNYLAYSAVMTPLVVLILDAGADGGANILIDRFVATLIGAGLTILAAVAFEWKLVSLPGKRASNSEG